MSHLKALRDALASLSGGRPKRPTPTTDEQLAVIARARLAANANQAMPLRRLHAQCIAGGAHRRKVDALAVLRRVLSERMAEQANPPPKE